MGEKKKLTFDEKLDLLAGKVLELLSGYVEEAGDQPPFRQFVTMDIPDWPQDDEALVEVYTSDQWRLRVGVHREGSDRFSWHFLDAGPRTYILERLGAPETHASARESILELTKSVDDWYAEHG